MKLRKKQEKGITLVALVVTIVVLIILATVSINMILDDKGIIGAAELAKEKYQNAAQKEKEDMYELEEYLGDNLESVGIVPTVEELQSRYEFEYYSSMVAAVKDVNNGTIGENADKNKGDEGVVAGIYTKEGNTYVVLLKDTTEEARIQPSVDMTINLGSHELSSDNAVGIEIGSGSTVTIDGRLEGSTINITHTGGTGARPIQAKEDSKLIINGGKYISNSEGYTKTGAAIFVKGEASISNAIIEATETTGDNIGIQISEVGTATISNCNITTISINGYAVGISNSNTATISDCNIKAYANYTMEGEDYQALSQGVRNGGNLTINNCYVMGTHCSLGNSGTLYVDGGTYEGYGHGGFYFEGTGNTSWIRNATIRECAMPEGYTATAIDCNAGFYIGGATGNDNIKVYMDSCDIYGSAHPIVFRGSSSEKNNSLYISNSKINTDKKIRIDNDTHKLYIGVGNNFTAANTDRSSAVVTTNDIYIKE